MGAWFESKSPHVAFQASQVYYIMRDHTMRDECQVDF